MGREKPFSQWTLCLFYKNCHGSKSTDLTLTQLTYLTLFFHTFPPNFLLALGIEACNTLIPSVSMCSFQKHKKQ